MGAEVLPGPFGIFIFERPVESSLGLDFLFDNCVGSGLGLDDGVIAWQRPAAADVGSCSSGLAVLGHQDGQLELGNTLEFEDENLHHLHQEVAPVGILLLAPGLDALHQIQQEFARHGLLVKENRKVF